MTALATILTALAGALIVGIACRPRKLKPCRCGPEECEGWGKKWFTCQREKRT